MTGIELSGNLAVDDVSVVRRLVEKLQRRFSTEHAERVAIAAHELLENAIKFSADGNASIRVDLGANEVSIKTRNKASAKNLASLQTISSTMAASDPLEFYVQCMANEPKARGGLGIGRIAYESDMKIGMSFDGDVVEIHATAALA